MLLIAIRIHLSLLVNFVFYSANLHLLFHHRYLLSTSRVYSLGMLFYEKVSYIKSAGASDPLSFCDLRLSTTNNKHLTCTYGVYMLKLYIYGKDTSVRLFTIPVV